MRQTIGTIEAITFRLVTIAMLMDLKTTGQDQSNAIACFLEKSDESTQSSICFVFTWVKLHRVSNLFFQYQRIFIIPLFPIQNLLEDLNIIVLQFALA